ncbi:glutathione-regulated potassium-efflux system protein KefC [Azohydromonas caseinilytica]|uniref:Glutathione-regulated potassium-efflux system protein KefC n=1 Tax=Azohydromonas caseinilytica TaxID=2728836 RepID=A0A848F6M6_9BURK|nr:glutathione-regulated potassium-efflux system protein KefC [Azohydromonas caseinilytica]NML14003.1 glutathione-regulated potassium-efflux system protein KefC [Azohydromonas caseinilytica]
MEHEVSGWLLSGLLYLGAAVIAVPLARRLGLGSILGYLGAGIAIGPFGLDLAGDAQAMLHFSEFGVVLMLFLVGMELEPRRLWAMRRPIFGWGSVQLIGSAALLAGVAMLLGTPGRLALVAALGLALSSTAIGLTELAERNLRSTAAGQGVLGVALLQDIAAIPILALIPLLAGVPHETVHEDGWAGWPAALRAALVIGAVVLGGRLLLRPALRWSARSRTPEVFTAASLLLVVAISALMQAAGLSMALGAFLAGVLLADSEYRRQIETDLEPFKGLLLGLFFMAVGMSVDFGVVASRPLALLGVVVGFVALKALLLMAMTTGMRLPLPERPVFVLLLAQGGEFGFVVFQAAALRGVMDAGTASLLVAAVALSMALTPLLLRAADRWLAPRLAAQRSHGELPVLEEPQQAPVIIAGFGRYGQVVGRLLAAQGLAATVLEHDADQVETVRRFGWPVFFGDATRLDLLRMAGAEQARVIVVAIDDIAQSLAVVDLVKQHFPQLQVVARARNVTHYYGLRHRGVSLIERETFDSALLSARSVLELMGYDREFARTQAQRFRAHSIELLEQMAPHFGDEQRLLAMARQGREQLEALWARERAERAEAAAARKAATGEAPLPAPGVAPSEPPPAG